MWVTPRGSAASEPRNYASESFFRRAWPRCPALFPAALPAERAATWDLGQQLEVLLWPRSTAAPRGFSRGNTNTRGMGCRLVSADTFATSHLCLTARSSRLAAFYRSSTSRQHPRCCPRNSFPPYFRGRFAEWRVSQLWGLGVRGSRAAPLRRAAHNSASMSRAWLPLYCPRGSLPLGDFANRANEKCAKFSEIKGY